MKISRHFFSTLTTLFIIETAIILAAFVSLPGRNESEDSYSIELEQMFFNSFTPTDSWGFIKNLELQSNNMIDTSYSLFRVIGKDSFWNSKIVNIDSYLWARNVTRNMKINYTDKIVIFSTIVKDLHLLKKSINERDSSVIFLILASEKEDQIDLLNKPLLRLPDLNIFILNKDFFNEGHLLALLEIADLYIAIDGIYALTAAGVDTPALVLLSNFEESELELDSVVESESPKDEISETDDQPIIDDDDSKEISDSEVESKTKETESDNRGSSLDLLVPNMILEDLLNHSLSIITRDSPLLTFHSYLNPTMGFGRSAESMAVALSKQNISIKYHPLNVNKLKSWEDVVKPEFREMMKFPKNEFSDFYLGYFIPHELETIDFDRHARKAKLSYLYSTFETTLVPCGWAKIVNRYDKLIVSCEDIKQAFIKGGVRIPIEVIPLGIDEADWPEFKRSLPPKVPFKFLMFADGDWVNHRKNYPLVYQAFKEEFGNDSSVELYLKLSSLAGIQTIPEENVKILSGKLSQKKLLTLMRKTHCMVFPSRGEGYGLPPREAMATGMPVILAGFAGLQSIARDDINYPMKWSWSNATGYDHRYRERNNGSDYLGQWAEVEVEEVKMKLRHVKENVRECAEKGRRGSAYVRQYETYTLTAKKNFKEFWILYLI